MTNLLHSPITVLPNVGKVRAALCAKLGVETVGGLLYHFPRAYQDRGNIRKVCLCEPDQTSAFLLTVATPPKTAKINRSMSITRFTAFDDSGKAAVTFFNQPFVKDAFQVGSTYRFYGKLKKKGGMPELLSPQYELYNEARPPADLYPIYPLTSGLNNKTLRSMVNNALGLFTRDGICYLPETLPPYLIEEYGLMSAGEAVSAMHRPSDTADWEKARRRLFFEQMLVFSLGISLNRKKMTSGEGRAFPVKKTDDAPLLKGLGFAFTGAQRRAADEIAEDMASVKGYPMARLLSGDVGSGKTAVAAYAAFQAMANGLQVSLMTPTEILARQHYKDLAPLFEAMGFSTALLLGSTKASEKAAVYFGMQSGQLSLVIGTHALLNEQARFRRLGLVITDEQHRFGFGQRAALLSQTLDKDHDPHMLAMSATPIPRTMALIVYGDMDLSHLNELPPGRQKVDTFLVDESYRRRLNGFIRKQVEEGGQVYIVCPAVESDGEEEILPEEDGEEQPLRPLKAAVNYAETLKNDIFPDLKVGFIHGKMPAASKDKVMADFASGEISILVSTTVIEVGVNVPNATLMIVENAERFGLSQLHQLRGRVGRGSKKAYCVLVSDSENEKTKERLTVMKTTYDGYKIAEQDLAQRGPGDFLPARGGGLRQHGELEFNVSPVDGDMELLKQAVECAKAIASDDPELADEKNALLRKAVGDLFHGNINA